MENSGQEEQVIRLLGLLLCLRHGHRLDWQLPVDHPSNLPLQIQCLEVLHRGQSIHGLRVELLLQES